MVHYSMDRMGKKFILAIAINVLFILGKTDSQIITGDAGYVVNQNAYTENGKCVQEISVSGNGISDSFQISCSDTGMNSINTGGVLMYGDPDKFCLYSESPNTLIVMENGKCTKKSYTTTGSGTTSSSEPLSDDQCTTLKNKIKEGIQKNEKYWADWSKKFTEQMTKTFSSGFPFNDGDDDDDDDDSSESSKKSGTKKSSNPWWDSLWS